LAALARAGSSIGAPVRCRCRCKKGRCREQVLVQGAGSRCRCRILRAEPTADQLQQGQGQGIQGENTPAMPAPAHEFREVESRSSAPSTVDRCRKVYTDGIIHIHFKVVITSHSICTRTVTEKALREIPTLLLGGCAWSCTGIKVEAGGEQILPK
jgi:hypothetical protein